MKADLTRVRHTSSDGSFSIHHSRDEVPNPDHFKLHYELGYELFLFLEGNGTYIIEGNRYELSPDSLLIMNSTELHALSISPDHPYERIVLTLKKDFLPPFLSHGVDFCRSLKYRKLGHGNLIQGELVRKNGILDYYGKLLRLLADPGPEEEFVAKCIIAELLASVNSIKENELLNAQLHKPAMTKIGELLEYINANLNEALTLDALAERFFLTKYHLCHIFKEATGYSINQYISYKRIHMADALMLEGYAPTQACFMSGFNSYSNFYKSYRKLTGRSPRHFKSGQ
ncbi:AraC family transcriptional regulator [Paenibacillus sp. YN15]|uniref:AraC family transcriptional regulator n=1 Tax=Paenibacillus sp. YN15 TaxID=1742774 RepID=UPI00215C085A|nr:AraC family transcriptional regulator [Paenibacillus sp. YN15]